MSELNKIENEIAAILNKERWSPLDQDTKQDDDLLPTWAMVAMLIVLFIAISCLCMTVFRIVL